MRTLLIYPPASDPAHPPLGICALAGYLLENGEDVDLLDLNIRSYVDFLTPDVLRQCADTLRARQSAFESEPVLAGSDVQQFRITTESLLSADLATGSIEWALDALRRLETYRTRASYEEASSVVNRAMELVSAAHYPVRWYPRVFSMDQLPTRSSAVLDAIRDREQNLFLPFMEREAAGIALRSPDLIGISINYYSQLVPGLTLAAELKRQIPGVHIVAGGGLICFLEGKWDALASFNHLIDAWVLYEGERPLLRYLKAFAAGAVPAGIPGVLRFEGAAPHYEPPEPAPAVSELPPPSFDGLPLDDYLSPVRLLPLLASRGCYWGRCAFCSHDYIYRGNFRAADPNRALEHMDLLAERYGAECFYFTDECLTPRLLRSLAGAETAERRRHDWLAEVRMEPALNSDFLRRLREGGCRMLMFGMESASQRILGRMHKGISLDTAANILRDCHAAGIRTMAMLIIGFPGELESEAEETLRFVEDRREMLSAASFTNFVLVERAPVFERPSEYGITEVLPVAGEDLRIFVDYRVESGLTAEQVTRIVEESRKRPELRGIREFSPISRTHLAFLPPYIPEPPADEKALLIDTAPAESLIPKRCRDLTPVALAFSLEEVGHALEEETPHDIAASPSNYAFSPEKNRLAAVGPDGLALLSACDGRSTLADILRAAGPENCSVVQQFYADMERRGLLEWDRT